MFNPFLPFSEKLLEKLIQSNRYYLISQTYDRGAVRSGEYTTPLLLCTYVDKGIALTHLDALAARPQKDKYAALIDLTKEAHIAKIKAILKPHSGYVVYSNFIKDKNDTKRKADMLFRKCLERYISRETTWRINRETTLKPSLQIVFGELFVSIKYGSQQIRVRLDDIEKY